LANLNDLSSQENTRLWAIRGLAPKQFVPQNCDVVRQLMAGFGFSVTEYHLSFDSGLGVNRICVAAAAAAGMPQMTHYLMSDEDIEDDQCPPLLVPLPYYIDPLFDGR
jgi:hypothetical protein